MPRDEWEARSSALRHEKMSMPSEVHLLAKDGSNVIQRYARHGQGPDMCTPNLRTHLAANPNAAPIDPGAAGSPLSLRPGVALAAFPAATQMARASSESVQAPRPTPTAAPTVRPARLPSPTPVAPLRANANIAAQQTATPPRATLPTSPAAPARRKPIGAARQSDILAGSRYDGLRGKDLDAALDDSYRTQKAIDAAAEWNATLGRITRDYQVPDDGKEMVRLPKVKQLLTSTERRSLIALRLKYGEWGESRFKQIYDQALSMTGTFIGLPTAAQIPPRVRNDIIRTHGQRDYDKYADLWRRTDGHSDAFRHAYWSALMEKTFGPSFAASYGAAHEGVPGNPQVSEAMDLFNNEAGRRIHEDHPNASDQQLAILVREALRNGKLVVVGQDGRLSWSNKVKWAEHGITPSKPGDIKGGKIFPDDGLPY